MTYRLTVISTGSVPGMREVPAGAKDVRFRLDAGLVATGRFLDLDGKPKQIGQLLVRAEDGREIRIYPSTDQEGRFRLFGLWRLHAGDREVGLRPETEEFSPGQLTRDR